MVVGVGVWKWCVGVCWGSSGGDRDGMGVRDWDGVEVVVRMRLGWGCVGVWVWSRWLWEMVVDGSSLRDVGVGGNGSVVGRVGCLWWWWCWWVYTVVLLVLVVMVEREGVEVVLMLVGESGCYWCWCW